MFQRCILIKEPLISTIAIIGNVDNLTNEDFELMQHYCEIFKLFKEATVELSSEKGVSISKVLIITQMLHSHIKNNKQNIQLPYSIHLMLSKMLTKATISGGIIEEIIIQICLR
ncbi:zinc finger BED domain-containing protein 4-like [Aphis craccivora]|uniref:Zinc finger BED domain-containing protein 4-like n=1 Tax=Aphis craccivora TaxID=307492 RepID=A0A6G0Y2N1_APHCR|nr:zinc finger BED domain-containing protein 4-like [Aphis craccivora]